jgi:hypothetical protein
MARLRVATVPPTEVSRTPPKRFVGSAIWRTETVTPAPGQPPELAVRADIEGARAQAGNELVAAPGGSNPYLHSAGGSQKQGYVI